MPVYDEDSITRPLVDPAKRKQLKVTISLDDDNYADSFLDSDNLQNTLPFSNADKSNKTPSSAVKNYVSKNSSLYDASQLAIPITAKRRVAIIVMSILLLIASISAILGVTYSMQLWGGKEIPSVVGINQMQAISTIENAGFVVNIDFVYSDEEKDSVVSQNPVAGQRGEQGSTVSLFIAKPRIMPDVINVSVDEAKKLIQNIGVNNIEVKEEQSDAPDNTVISSSIAAGEKVSADTTVVLTVATPHLIPDVMGMPMRSAKRVLEDAGYIVDIGEETNENVAEDTIVAMQPDANSAYALGQKVIIIVAIHPSNTLIAEVQSYFSNVSDFMYENKYYELVEVISIRYSGSNTCEYKIKARPYETQSWGADKGRRRYGAIVELSGRVTLGNDGAITSFDPPIEKL